MSNFNSKDYLKWAKEYLKINKKKIPVKISGSKYSRRDDLDYSKKLKSLTGSFTKTYPLHTITNEPREKNRFFRALYQNKVYHPDFHYKKKPPLDFRKARDLIKKLDKFAKKLPCDQALGQIYQRRIFDAQRAITLTSLSQKKGFSWASKEYYKFKAAGKRTLPEKITFPHNRQEYIEAYEIVYLAQKILKEIGLKHKARVSSSRYRFRGMATTNRSVKIGVGTLRSPARIIRSLAHEILGHALCSTNARKYPAYFARKNNVTTLLKEEGMAVKIGELSYQNLKKSLPRRLRSKREDFIPHLRIKAIQIATRHSFYQTFFKLNKLNINKNLAWELTTRVKRGVADTSLSGANYHDSLYYLGLEKINKLISEQKLNFQQTILLFNKLNQGKFDLLEFSYLNKLFPAHQNLDLEKAFNVFNKEFKKIIKTKLIK